MIVVYTALFGNKDCLWAPYPIKLRDDVAYVCFTDQERRQPGLWGYDYAFSREVIVADSHVYDAISPVHWEQRIVKSSDNSRLLARKHKVLSHQLFPDVECTIWVDANVRFSLPPSKVISFWLKGSFIAAFNHPSRKCYSEEAAACVALDKDDPLVLRDQVKSYRSEGMPNRFGLASTRCLIRRNGTHLREFEREWWKQIKRWSLRDQISFPYVCWKQNVKWAVIQGHADLPWLEVSNPHFWYTPHGHRVRRFAPR